MRRRDVLSLGASMLTVPLLASAEGVMNQHATGRLYRIAELQIDPATGHLSMTDVSAVVGSPVCVLFVPDDVLTILH